ncbi:MAG TPA: transglycosylase SLT domain-containing protein [Pyrinomonadaceae bacterium]|nr:transglycosylase SLT domain-containing protein [Pyrinomonadaceae bacterium]
MKFASLVLLLALAFPVAAQSSDRIVAAVESQDWQTARSEIDKLRTSNAALFREKNYEYLLGRIAERTGDVASATQSYQTIVSNDSRFKQYALWRLAKLARATGDLVLERERLQQLVASSPSGLLYEAATLRLTESFFESGDFPAAANSAKALTLSKTTSVARKGMALMASSYLKAGKTAEARDVFTKLVMQMPDASRPDDFALEAVRQLDLLDKASTATLSEAEHLLRASVYHFNRDFAGARFHYQSVVDRFPQSTTVPNATYQLARGLYLEEKYDDAVKLFQKVVDSYPQSLSARDALTFLGSSYIRMKRTDDAVAAYKLFLDRFPDAPNPERTYLNIIDALHEAGRYPEALNWVQQARTRFRNDIGGALALFAQLRINMAQQSWSNVVRDADELLKLSDLGGTRVPGGTNPAEVTFVRGYALEQLGRNEEAIAAYLSIPDGRNEYYGRRATQRLLELANNEKSRTLVKMRLNALTSEGKAALASGQFEQARTAAQSSLRLTNDLQIRADALKTLQTAYNALPAYRVPKFNRVSLLGNAADPSEKDSPDAVSDNLLTLGLYDEALPEILARAQNRTPDEDYTIAMLSLRAGIPTRAVRFGEQTWRPIPADFVIELAPRDLLELLYPVPFRESLLKHAPGRNVDPRFVLSIARQESRFQTDAKSAAAARGMTQFIAATANDIATQLNMRYFKQDDLYNPDTAILFGSQYLSNLFQQFPNQPQAVAGAYNGGEDNLARWIGRARSNEADRYVPEIGFTQTRDYVYKVMANFWTYQRLYDAQLQPVATTTK